MENQAFEMLSRLLKSDRSVRRFKEDETVTADTLSTLVNLTRYCGSGRNLQPLRYRIVTDTAEKEAIFPKLAWAGYLTDWDGPEPGERPAAYLVQCLDTSLTQNCLCDDGLQLQAITLGATAMGLGCCIIKAFNAPCVAEALALAPHLQPRYVLALGYPAEKVEIEDMTDDYKYYRTADGIHHVPKRTLEELIVK